MGESKRDRSRLQGTEEGVSVPKHPPLCRGVRMPWDLVNRKKGRRKYGLKETRNGVVGKESAVCVCSEGKVCSL